MRDAICSVVRRLPWRTLSGDTSVHRTKRVPGEGLLCRAKADTTDVCLVSAVQASDLMTEGLVSLADLSGLAWRTLSQDTSVHGTKGCSERVCFAGQRSTPLISTW